MTVKQAAEKWGLSENTIRTYCRDGRFPGAEKTSSGWQIPDDTEMPEGIVVQMAEPASQPEKQSKFGKGDLIAGLLALAFGFLGSYLLSIDSVVFSLIVIAVASFLVVYLVNKFGKPQNEDKAMAFTIGIVLLIFIGIGLLMTPSSGGGGGGPSCKNCGRRTSVSPLTGYCTTCDEGFWDFVD